MKPKIRVKLNNNGNVEEWWPLDLVLEDLLGAIALQANMMHLMMEWGDCLQARIERLERMLAKNGTAEAIELRSQLISEVNGRYIGEEPEPNGARWRDIAQREVEEHGPVTPEEAREMNEPHKLGIIAALTAAGGKLNEALFDAVDDLIYDAETNSYPLGQFNAEYLDALREVFLLICRERAGVPNRCPRCGEPFPSGLGWGVLADLCAECESELAEERINHSGFLPGYDDIDWQAEIIEEEGL